MATGLAMLSRPVEGADVPIDAQILNIVLRGALCALQLSHREGFEVKVTEAIAKGVPVVAYRTGGIPFQVISEEDTLDCVVTSVPWIDSVFSVLSRSATGRRATSCRWATRTRWWSTSSSSAPTR